MTTPPAPGSAGCAMLGQRFGRLVVTAEHPERSKDKQIQWLCRCDCGTEKTLRGGTLRRGLVKSCGCLKAEQHSQRFTINMAGQIHGRLTVVSRAGSGPGGVAMWLCVCRCGQQVTTSGAGLRSGKTKSCGCLMVDRIRQANSKEVVTYTGAHARIRRLRGSATAHLCADCDGPASDWSYNHQDPNELRSTAGGWAVRYSLSPTYYEPRCRTCHNRFDHPAKETA